MPPGRIYFWSFKCPKFSFESLVTLAVTVFQTTTLHPPPRSSSTLGLPPPCLLVLSTLIEFFKSCLEVWWCFFMGFSCTLKFCCYYFQSPPWSRPTPTFQSYSTLVNLPVISGQLISCSSASQARPSISLGKTVHCWLQILRCNTLSIKTRH